MEPCTQHRQTAVTVHASLAARWGWLSKPDRSAINGAGLWQMRQAVLKKKKKEKKEETKDRGRAQHSYAAVRSRQGVTAVTAVCV